MKKFKQVIGAKRIITTPPGAAPMVFTIVAKVVGRSETRCANVLARILSEASVAAFHDELGDSSYMELEGNTIPDEAPSEEYATKIRVFRS